MKKLIISFFMSLCFLSLSYAAPSGVDMLTNQEKEIIDKKIDKTVKLLFKNGGSDSVQYKKIILLLENKINSYKSNGKFNKSYEITNYVKSSLILKMKNYDTFHRNGQGINKYYQKINYGELEKAYNMRYDTNISLDKFIEWYGNIEYIKNEIVSESGDNSYLVNVSLKEKGINIVRNYEVKIQLIDFKIKTIYSKEVSTDESNSLRIKIPRVMSEGLPYCLKSFNSDTSDEYYEYSNNELGIKLQFPYNKKWGDPYYKFTYYDEINDIDKYITQDYDIGKNVKTISFGLPKLQYIAIDACYLFETKFLIVLEKLSKEKLITNFKPNAELNNYNYVKEIKYNNFDILEFSIGSMCPSDGIIVLGNKYNYYFYKECGAKLEDFKSILDSLEFID